MGSARPGPPDRVIAIAVRWRDSVAMPALIGFRAWNPGGREQIECLPQVPGTWTRDIITQALGRFGPKRRLIKFDGLEQREPMSSREVLRELVVPRYRGRTADQRAGRLRGGPLTFLDTASLSRQMPGLQQYMQGVQQRMQTLQQMAPAQRASFQRSMHRLSDVSRTLSETSDMISSGYGSRSAAYDRMSANWSEAMRGVDTYVTPGGSSVELPGGYEHAWSNGLGEYVMTDSGFLNPNDFASGYWERMQRGR